LRRINISYSTGMNNKSCMRKYVESQNAQYSIISKEIFRGKKVLIMGLGRFGGGVDVSKFAANAGAKVIVTDLLTKQKLSDSISQLGEFPDIEYHLGSHSKADFLQADIIVANPAVHPDNDFLQLARKHNKFVTSQINIFFQLCPATIIGITGANGKSTTTALTAHLLRGTMDDGRRTSDELVIASEAKQSQTTQYAIRNTQYETVWLSGNIGNEPLLTILNQIKANDLVVLELSSFQLEQLVLRSEILRRVALAQIQSAVGGPNVALLTNLTPNHLDRYGTFADYCAAKENIFKLQQLDRNNPAVSIFNAEDEIAGEWFEKYKCDTGPQGTGRICIKFSADDISRDIRDNFTLPGRANLSNLAGAVSIAKLFGADDERIKNALATFKALPHRLEFVQRIKGVRWYNDSKATTPQSAIAALEAFDEPMILIAGGYDKHLPFDELGQKIAEKAKAAILIGQTAEKIAEAIKSAITSLRVRQGGRSNLNKRDTRYEIRDTRVKIVKSLDEAVELANRLAVSGDVVLLSPACASYDMFENFEQRGREFVRYIRALSS
jgi:UDP-N-acetylmuramoylalanine--D-glutamate ligase